MDENFKAFYKTLDPSKFKYFVRENSYFVYNSDIDFLPANMKPKTERAIRLQSVDQIVKELLVIKKVPVEEYTGFTLTKKGFPGDYLNFLDICITDAIPPTIFAVSSNETNQVSVAFIKDSKIMHCSFQDDDLFSQLYSFSSSLNCIEFLYNNKSLERVFNTWGISCHLVKFSNVVDMIKGYMKIDFECSKFIKEDSCLLNIADFDLVDFGCVTQQGKRLVNQWLRAPSLDRVEINQRLDLSECFVDLRLNLSKFVDLKRMATRIFNKSISLSETIKLCEVIEQLPEIISILREKAESMGNDIRQDSGKKELLISSLVDPLESLMKVLEPVVYEIKSKINFRTSRIHSHLSDELIALEKLKFEILEQIENEFLRVKKEFPKVSFNNRMLRISRLDYNQTDFDSKKYVVISLLKTGAHFVTKNLSDLNEKLEKVEKEIVNAESLFFDHIKLTIFNYIPPIETFNFLIALMDVYKAFSYKVTSSMYSRPIFDDRIYEIKGMFHPMLEHKGAILNDISYEKNLCVLTGPNMGGKSTLIKTLSMVTLYAQIGCYVPAKSARLPIFDRIFLRIGARDCSSQRMSTFMVEMTDLNKIIRTATPRSLILIDELGRGTSAIDGLSLVLSVKEYLIGLKAKALMATHFSQVGDDRTLNKKMCVEGSVLTYKIEDGTCDTSFGIKVAEMANFPPSVLEKAKFYIRQGRN